MDLPLRAETEAAETRILSTDVPSGLEVQSVQFFESFPYTTTALYSLETWLRTLPDHEAADLVHECMLSMARHEARHI